MLRCLGPSAAHTGASNSLEWRACATWYLPLSLWPVRWYRVAEATGMCSYRRVDRCWDPKASACTHCDPMCRPARSHSCWLGCSRSHLAMALLRASSSAPCWVSLPSAVSRRPSDPIAPSRTTPPHSPHCLAEPWWCSGGRSSAGTATSMTHSCSLRQPPRCSACVAVELCSRRCSSASPSPQNHGPSSSCRSRLAPQGRCGNVCSRHSFRVSLAAACGFRSSSPSRTRCGPSSQPSAWRPTRCSSCSGWPTAQFPAGCASPSFLGHSHLQHWWCGAVASAECCWPQWPCG